jgi:predicted phosphodiesterase
MARKRRSAQVGRLSILACRPDKQSQETIINRSHTTALRSGIQALVTVFVLMTSHVSVADRIVVISDVNGSYGSTEYNPRVQRAVDRILEMQPDLVISAGDMVAGQKQPLLDEARLNAMWTSFHTLVTDPLRASNIDFIVSPGNHDGSALPGFERERRAFREQWSVRLPRASMLVGSDWPRRHAMWLNDILIVVIDGSRAGPLAPADRDLLRRALSEGAEARARIVVSHLPAWPFAQGREREIIDDEVLSGLIRQGKIDFLVSGHHHVFYPGRDRYGTIHLAAGALGGNVRKIVGRNEHSAFSFMVLDFCDDAWRVSAFKAPVFEDEVETGKLPARLLSGHDELLRTDRSESQSPEGCP